MTLRKCHVIALREHQEVINEGLRRIPKKLGGRPVKEDLTMRRIPTDADATIGGHSFPLDIFEMHTFYTTCSESSLHDVRSTSSAP